MSEIKVNKLSPRTNCGTVTLGDSGDTFTIPAGVSITNNGTASGFGATGAVSWNTTVKTSGFTAVAGEGYFVNTTGGAVSVNLPAGTAGAVVAIKDYAGTFDTGTLTLVPNGSDKIGGNNTVDATLTTEGIAVTLVFVDSTQGWLVTDDGLQSQAPTVSYSVEQLIVAGGAGSGGDRGGGGGAGGFRTLTNTFLGGLTYTITVGSGGAGGTSSGDGSSGGNSSVIGGATSNTSAGGGGGGGGQGTTGTPGVAGGSGGGGSANPSNNAVGGAGNTPATTPSQGNNGGDANTSWTDLGAGGGGGAGAVGSNGSGNTGGNAGNGTASSITGSAVTYAGGGGGGGNGGYGSGGSGGGGAGGNPGTAGTDGLGGGGGGVQFAATGVDGGDGIVILSMLDADYSGTTTGSPTVATGVSGKTVLTFTGNGSYTA